MPSTTASVLNNTSRPGTPRSSTAQSSPTPATTDELVGSERARRSMSSNSFTESTAAGVLHVEEPEEIRRVEQRMGKDRREQARRTLIEQGEHHPKEAQGSE